MLSKLAGTILRTAVASLFVLTGASLAMETDGGGGGGGGGGVQRHVSMRSAVQQQGLETSPARLEAVRDGGMELVAVKFAITVDAWNEAGNDAPPALLGREFERDSEFLGEPVYLLVVPVEPWDPAGGFPH